MLCSASQRPASHRPIKVDGDVGRWGGAEGVLVDGVQGILVEVSSIINIIIL